MTWICCFAVFYVMWRLGRRTKFTKPYQYIPSVLLVLAAWNMVDLFEKAYVVVMACVIVLLKQAVTAEIIAVTGDVTAFIFSILAACCYGFGVGSIATGIAGGDGCECIAR